MADSGILKRLIGFDNMTFFRVNALVFVPF